MELREISPGTIVTTIAVRQGAQLLTSGFGPLPPRAAGEAVWEANTEAASSLFDPCRFIRQVKQFGKLTWAVPTPTPAASCGRGRREKKSSR